MGPELEPPIESESILKLNKVKEIRPAVSLQNKILYRLAQLKTQR